MSLDGIVGQPVLIDEVLFKTQHGIVDQSLHARLGAEPANGDGFGLGWYGCSSTTATSPTSTCSGDR